MFFRKNETQKEGQKHEQRKQTENVKDEKHGEERKSKRKHEETHERDTGGGNGAQQQQAQLDSASVHTPTLEAPFAPTASHARHVTHDT